MGNFHVLKPTPKTVHCGYFSSEVEPVLTIASGDTVEVETFSYPHGHDFPELRTPGLDEILQQVHDIGPGPHILTGPIYVETAEPGSVLAVKIESVQPLIPYGYNMIRPGAHGFGLLPEDFPVGRLKVLALDDKRRCVRITDKLSLPIKPFFGVMATSPAEPERWNSRVPGPFGGNMDIRELGAGATLYLPVFVPGGLLSIGDGHGVQGNGEVNLSGLEMSMHGRIMVEVKHNWKLERPMIETPTHFITTGFHEDLNEAAKIATRDMVSWLRMYANVDALDAYTLCSLALDLNVSQVVNFRKGIHAMIAKEILEGKQ